MNQKTLHIFFLLFVTPMATILSSDGANTPHSPLLDFSQRSVAYRNLSPHDYPAEDFLTASSHSNDVSPDAGKKTRTPSLKSNARSTSVQPLIMVTQQAKVAHGQSAYTPVKTPSQHACSNDESFKSPLLFSRKTTDVLFESSDTDSLASLTHAVNELQRDMRDLKNTHTVPSSRNLCSEHDRTLTSAHRQIATTAQELVIAQHQAHQATAMHKKTQTALAQAERRKRQFAVAATVATLANFECVRTFVTHTVFVPTLKLLAKLGDAQQPSK